MTLLFDTPTETLTLTCAECNRPKHYECAHCGTLLCPEHYGKHVCDTLSGWQLRPYQREQARAAWSQLSNGSRATLVVAPTGTGKTVMFGHFTRQFLARYPDKRVLIMAHRDQLIRQGAHKVGQITGLPCDIEMGDYRADQGELGYRAPVVVTSVQTMSRRSRQERFNPADFGLLVVDEAHHTVAPSYMSVIEHFKSDGDLWCLGLTASPDRADERALGIVYETVAHEYNILDAIQDGWLVPIEQQFVTLEHLDLSGLKTPKGDFTDKALGKILEEEQVCHEIAIPLLEHAGHLKTIVFCAAVEQASLLSEILNRHRPGCSDWICSDEKKCTKEHRHNALRAFTRGEITYLVNVAILTEGWDEPTVECVACARPTKSRALYAQVAGRGTRPLPGIVDGLDGAEERRQAIAASAKPSVLILDFVGNSGRHKLIHAGDLLGGQYDDEVVAMATAEAEAASERGERTDTVRALAEAERKQREERTKRRRSILLRGKSQLRRVDPFAVWDMTPKREPGWHKGRPPTAKQLACLERVGVETDGLSFHQASQLIDQMIKRREKNQCTYKQAKLLMKWGVTPDLTFDQARALIDRVAANGWRFQQSFVDDLDSEAI